jgi:Activator of Hsp90 ATPase homolog 1-like protein
VSVVRTVEVAVDPLTAFETFTDEIGEWYQSGPHSWNDPERAVDIRFEPGVGGRWLEVWDEATGEGYELGRIQVWEPGKRLVVSYRNVQLPLGLETEIEVRFEPDGAVTRVTLEHRGLEALPPDELALWERRAWVNFMRWFRDHAGAKT